MGWHSDDEPLFGECGEAKLNVSVGFGSPAIFSLGSGFSRLQGVCGGGGYFRCLRALCTGYGRDRTAQRGRSFVIPRVLLRTRTGKAQLSGHMLLSGVGQCILVCGGLSHL